MLAENTSCIFSILKWKCSKYMTTLNKEILITTTFIDNTCSVQRFECHSMSGSIIIYLKAQRPLDVYYEGIPSRLFACKRCTCVTATTQNTQTTTATTTTEAALTTTTLNQQTTTGISRRAFVFAWYTNTIYGRRKAHFFLTKTLPYINVSAYSYKLTFSYSLDVTGTYTVKVYRYYTVKKQKWDYFRTFSAVWVP